ncbi:MAG: UDP-N-acetylmuramate--L-alanine ligase [Elusimicrobia bacterium]|nr:UDP-N-acetylmuramate--L-alanine ligase [Elusimicrobiota bacterium]
MFEKIKKIHFVGIGGSGMCGIAEVLLNMGYSVSGSDIKESEDVARLKKLGAEIYIGHRKENINGPHVVVVSSAIDRENEEVAAAHVKKIPVIPRAEMLTELMRLKYALCIAGTHGKTTTTSMVGLVLSRAGLDPTLVVGGRLKNLNSNAKLGGGEYIVAEADESDGSFLHLTPTISIVTNIDNDHMDYYKDMGRLKKTFTEFLNKVPFYGFSVVCGDDGNIRDILPQLNKPFKTYGYGESNDYTARDVLLCPEKSCYSVYRKKEKIGELVVNSTGRHNILNSLAACITGLEIGISFDRIREGLAEYRGVGRRMEMLCDADGIKFYDDYAHHPTEINLSLRSLREIYPDRRIVAVFQPHRYTRTRDLCAAFPGSLEIADVVFITDIYPAGEKPIEGVTSRLIVDNFSDMGKVNYISDITELSAAVAGVLKKDDICVTLGAGNINTLAYRITGDMKSKKD